MVVPTDPGSRGLGDEEDWALSVEDGIVVDCWASVEARKRL